MLFRTQCEIMDQTSICLALKAYDRYLVHVATSFFSYSHSAGLARSSSQGKFLLR